MRGRMASRRSRTLRVALCLVLALGPFTASAQGTTGRITGTIRDATLAAVPDVRATAIDIESRRQWAAVSDDTGTYNFPSLPPGTYDLTATHAGFKTVTVQALNLETSSVVRLDIQMEVGPLAGSRGNHRREGHAAH